jgi:hypothetical protein
MASIPSTALGDIILSNLKQRLLTPDRLVSLLQSLTDRQHRRGYGFRAMAGGTPTIPGKLVQKKPLNLSGFFRSCLYKPTTRRLRLFGAYGDQPEPADR